MSFKIENDISAITGIPKLTLETLFNRMSLCIGHAVWESTCKNDVLTDVDIGIGTLYIKLEDNNIKYKFIPSDKLNNTVQLSVKSKNSPLLTAAETSLQKKIENTYKELL